MTSSNVMNRYTDAHIHIHVRTCTETHTVYTKAYTKQTNSLCDAIISLQIKWSNLLRNFYVLPHWSGCRCGFVDCPHCLWFIFLSILKWHSVRAYFPIGYPYIAFLSFSFGRKPFFSIQTTNGSDGVRVPVFSARYYPHIKWYSLLLAHSGGFRVVGSAKSLPYKILTARCVSQHGKWQWQRQYHQCHC